MKPFLFLALFISGTAFAQTNIIAAKSHASAQMIDNQDLDNFGNPMEQRTIESVKYLNDDCILETYTSFWTEQGKEYDTICDHPFLLPGQTDINRIKAMYPDGTKFSGFDTFEIEGKKSKRMLRKEKKENRTKESSAILLFIIGGGLFLIYLFIPKMNLSKS